MAKQQLTRPDALTFHKWDEVGQTLDFIADGEPVFDRPNQFGSKDSFIRGIIEADGSQVQVPMTYDFAHKVRPIADLILPGVTKFSVRFTGTKPIKGKAPMKLYDVEVEGLKEV